MKLGFAWYSGEVGADLKDARANARSCQHRCPFGGTPVSAADELEAFQRDDEVTAFSYAAPRVRAHFRTPANFMQMVRDSYRAVYRPRAVKFLEGRQWSKAK